MKHWKALALNDEWIVAEFDDTGNYMGKIGNCGNEALARRIATVPDLEAVIDKLPKDHDGVPIVPFGGEVVWVFTRRSGLYRPGESAKWWPMTIDTYKDGLLNGMVAGSHYARHVRPEDCYSSSEAAKANDE